MSVDCLKRRRYAALVGLGRPSAWDEGEARITSPFDNPHDAENTARMGDKAKPLAAYRRRLCCLWESRSFFIEMVTLAGLEPATSPVPRTLCPP